MSSAFQFHLKWLCLRFYYLSDRLELIFQQFFNQSRGRKEQIGEQRTNTMQLLRLEAVHIG
jgi:hypothetical protein